MYPHPSVFAVPTARRESASNVIFLVSLVIFVYLFMIKQQRTDKLIAVPRNLFVLLGDENPS